MPIPSSSLEYFCFKLPCGPTKGSSRFKPFDKAQFEPCVRHFAQLNKSVRYVVIEMIYLDADDEVVAWQVSKRDLYYRDVIELSVLPIKSARQIINEQCL